VKIVANQDPVLPSGVTDTTGTARRVIGLTEGNQSTTIMKRRRSKSQNMTLMPNLISKTIFAMTISQPTTKGMKKK
jgi:hypothetical protein